MCLTWNARRMSTAARKSSVASQLLRREESARLPTEEIAEREERDERGETEELEGGEGLGFRGRGGRGEGGRG